MHYLSHAAMTACALVLFSACSASDSEPAADDSAGTPATDLAPGATLTSGQAGCENSQLTMNFNPMYSAYDGVRLFQVPASIAGVDAASVTWSLSDPAIAAIEAVPNGVILTTQAAGTATLTASAGGGALCGTAELIVSAVDPGLWEIGNARYSDGIELMFPTAGMGSGPPTIPSEPIEAACTNCHGESATDGIFRTVAHTPTQTGGFSDEELIRVFTEGTIPEGSNFDESIVPLSIWRNFHRWAMTEQQEQAMVVYLRSLSPSEQTGTIVFERPDMGQGNGPPSADPAAPPSADPAAPGGTDPETPGGAGQ